jgi:hypothetical protein
MHSKGQEKEKVYPFCIVLWFDLEEEGLDCPDGGGGIASGVVPMGDGL